MFPKNEALAIILVGSGSPPPWTLNGMVRHPSQVKRGGKWRKRLVTEIINTGKENNQLTRRTNQDPNDKNNPRGVVWRKFFLLINNAGDIWCVSVIHVVCMCVNIFE